MPSQLLNRRSGNLLTRTWVMKRQLRETGLEVLGAVPWGTHVCLFYDTRQDLLETLVPYLKAGLNDNEFCIWVLSESLGEQESKRAMKKVMPDFARYQAKYMSEPSIQRVDSSFAPYSTTTLSNSPSGRMLAFNSISLAQ